MEGDGQDPAKRWIDEKAQDLAPIRGKTKTKGGKQLPSSPALPPCFSLQLYRGDAPLTLSWRILGPLSSIRGGCFRPIIMRQSRGKLGEFRASIQSPLSLSLSLPFFHFNPIIILPFSSINPLLLAIQRIEANFVFLPKYK